MGQATQSNEARLNGIKALSKKFQSDVHALKAAQTDLNTCTQGANELFGRWNVHASMFSLDNNNFHMGDIDIVVTMSKNVAENYTLTFPVGDTPISFELHTAKAHVFDGTTTDGTSTFNLHCEITNGQLTGTMLRTDPDWHYKFTLVGAKIP